MPKHVDHGQRRREIARAAIRVLAREGLTGLSFRSLAAEMGGSLTLVTHYYSTRDELLADIPAQMVLDWQAEVDALDLDPDPLVRLRNLLTWLLPTDVSGFDEEVARFALVASREQVAPIRSVQEFDTYIRALIRDHVKPLVSPDDLEDTVDLLRALTNGITVQALTSPEGCPPSRQLRILEAGMNSILRQPSVEPGHPDEG